MAIFFLAWWFGADQSIKCHSHFKERFRIMQMEKWYRKEGEREAENDEQLDFLRHKIELYSGKIIELWFGVIIHQ